MQAGWGSLDQHCRLSARTAALWLLRDCDGCASACSFAQSVRCGMKCSQCSTLQETATGPTEFGVMAQSGLGRPAPN
jgi:hypothetical protein